MYVKCPECGIDVKLPSGLIFATEARGIRCPYCDETIPAAVVAEDLLSC